MRGVNAELAPWLRMTAPAGAATFRIEDAPVGQALFSSWLLLGGVLPIDRHHFRLAEVARGRGFLEDSTSWSQQRWEHRRDVEPRGSAACLLTDRLTFTPRVRAARVILAPIIDAIFTHRHRRLRAHFGGRAS
jgi:hypothetical protein